MTTTQTRNAVVAAEKKQSTYLVVPFQFKMSIRALNS